MLTALLAFQCHDMLTYTIMYVRMRAALSILASVPHYEPIFSINFRDHCDFSAGKEGILFSRCRRDLHSAHQHYQSLWSSFRCFFRRDSQGIADI